MKKLKERPKCTKCELNYVNNEGDVCDECRGIKSKVIFLNLESGKLYGHNSREIYELGCENLSWDKTRLSSFGPQQRLYSDNCDKFGYGVWFISHSNLTPKNPFIEDEHVKNNISSDYCKIIEEIDEEDNRAQKIAKSKFRVVFAKIERKFNMYEFLGVYETVINKSNRREHIKISEHYPIG